MRNTLRYGILFALLALPQLAIAAQVNVSIGDNFFSSKSTTINSGDTVVWTNHGSMAHTVTADNNSFNSGSIPVGASFSQTFTTPGTYSYFCQFHGAAGGVGMSGSITAASQTTSVAPTQSTNISSNVSSNTSANNSQSATVASLQAQAQALIQQIQQMQAQLSAGGSVSTGTSGVTTVVNSSACPNIGRSLKLGSTGDDVSNLQKFLAQDPTIYPEAMVTGYYGVLTQTAVQRWQTKYNIVSSGNAATTGYGVVGPRTAAAIALLCSTRTTSGSSTPAPTPAPTAPPATVGGFIQVSPVSGNAPLAVNVVANVNSINSCNGGNYTLDFGDGTALQQIAVQAGNCGQLTQNYQHTYLFGGVYKITLASGAHSTNATVTVAGPSIPSPQSTTTAPVTHPDSLGASVTSGVAPLSITFAGNVSSADSAGCTSNCVDTIDFGDGSTGLVPLPTAANSFQSFSIAHTYTSAQIYNAVLKTAQGASANDPTITITVTSSAQTPPVTQPPNTTGSFGIISLTPGVNNDPLSVGVAIAVPSPCSAAPLIDWGDGTTPTTASGSGTSCPASGFSTTHAYAQAGSYTISLEDSTGVVQATGAIAISN